MGRLEFLNLFLSLSNRRKKTSRLLLSILRVMYSLLDRLYSPFPLYSLL